MVNKSFFESTNLATLRRATVKQIYFVFETNIFKLQQIKFKFK